MRRILGPSPPIVSGLRMSIVSNQVLQFLRSDQPPRFMKMESQLFIAHTRELDANPTSSANIWWSVILLRLRFDQHRLNSNRSRNRYSNVSIVVMIDGAHREHSLADEECWFAMRQLLHRLGQRGTNASHAFYLFLTGGLWLCGWSLHSNRSLTRLSKGKHS